MALTTLVLLLDTFMRSIYFQIVGPFAAKEIFLVDDFRLLVNIEKSERISPVVEAAKSLELKTELNG
jgi:hypothetical protein